MESRDTDIRNPDGFIAKGDKRLTRYFSVI